MMIVSYRIVLCSSTVIRLKKNHAVQVATKVCTSSTVFNEIEQIKEDVSFDMYTVHTTCYDHHELNCLMV
jgi:hypothetical protein